MRFYPYDGAGDKIEVFLHQLNRILYPLVELKSEEEVEEFFESIEDVWRGDYETNYFKKHKDVLPPLTEIYQKLRYKTRVVCFLYDKEEYKTEFKNLKEAARYLATRENLRVGYVDDKRIIKKLKLKHGVKYF